jgi:hypothetical protein
VPCHSSGRSATDPRSARALAKGEQFHSHVPMDGEEMFVISGKFIDAYERSPHMSMHTPYVEQETLLWMKVTHLPNQGGLGAITAP